MNTSSTVTTTQHHHASQNVASSNTIRNLLAMQTSSTVPLLNSNNNELASAAPSASIATNSSSSSLQSNPIGKNIRMSTGVAALIGNNSSLPITTSRNGTGKQPPLQATHGQQQQQLPQSTSFYSTSASSTTNMPKTMSTSYSLMSASGVSNSSAQLPIKGVDDIKAKYNNKSSNMIDHTPQQKPLSALLTAVLSPNQIAPASSNPVTTNVIDIGDSSDIGKSIEVVKKPTGGKRGRKSHQVN
jgi:hypothetical protein